MSSILENYDPLDDFPTDEQLETIEHWDVNDIEGCLRYIGSLWHTCGRWKEGNGFFVFATGGWSGNEALLGALKASDIWPIILWDSLYIPGGLLIIAVSKKAKIQLDKVMEKLTKWAWRRVE